MAYGTHTHTHTHTHTTHMQEAIEMFEAGLAAGTDDMEVSAYPTLASAPHECLSYTRRVACTRPPPNETCATACCEPTRRDRRARDADAARRYSCWRTACSTGCSCWRVSAQGAAGLLRAAWGAVLGRLTVAQGAVLEFLQHMGAIVT